MHDLSHLLEILVHRISQLSGTLGRWDADFNAWFITAFSDLGTECSTENDTPLDFFRKTFTTHGKIIFLWSYHTHFQMIHRQSQFHKNIILDLYHVLKLTSKFISWFWKKCKIENTKSVPHESFEIFILISKFNHTLAFKMPHVPQVAD